MSVVINLPHISTQTEPHNPELRRKQTSPSQNIYIFWHHKNSYVKIAKSHNVMLALHQCKCKSASFLHWKSNTALWESFAWSHILCVNLGYARHESQPSRIVAQLCIVLVNGEGCSFVLQVFLQVVLGFSVHSESRRMYTYKIEVAILQTLYRHCVCVYFYDHILTNGKTLNFR